MAGPVMNKACKKILALSIGLALAACQGQSGGNQAGGNESLPAEGNLVGARIGGDFTLTDQNGKSVRWADFQGKYRLVYFGYTFCPDVCPLDLNRIMLGYRMLEKDHPEVAAKIQPIFITVDPERDTVDVVKGYVAHFHPRLIGLTGTPEQIEKVKTDFVVVASKEGDQAAKQDYLVNHTRTPFLFGPDGKPIALVPVEELASADETVAKGVHDFLVHYVR
nr:MULTISPECIES: SCO family protein [Sphingobium]